MSLLVLVGMGTWEYQHWHEQKSQDERRTSRLIACLEAAERAVDTTAATNACAVQYADRVPALLESNPYALVPRPTTASESSLLGALSPADSPAPSATPPPSPSQAAERAISPSPTRSVAGPVEAPEVRDPTSQQRAEPAGRPDGPPERADARTRGSADPPPVTRGEDVSGERPAVAEPVPSAPGDAGPSDEARPGGAAGSTPGR